MTTRDWEADVASLWNRAGTMDDHDLLNAMIDLSGERDDDDPAALFELASAYDYSGHPTEAARSYERALEAGLSGVRARRAKIQCASTLRNMGRAQEAVELLAPELTPVSDGLDDAVSAFMALALADAGREREGLALTLGALSSHLPRYNRAVSRYARELL